MALRASEALIASPDLASTNFLSVCVCVSSPKFLKIAITSNFAQSTYNTDAIYSIDLI